ncbi:MAG: exodeoxyribonuclease VII large subunit [Bacteroidota bacterium]
MGNGFYTVSGLARLVKTILDEAPVLRGIWVRGEIAGFNHHGSGHMYFNLKDAGARLRCVMFRGQNRDLRFRPTDGMEVLAFGSISVYERNGDYQLYVEALEPAGLGALYLAFVQLRERLAREGLFDEARKRALPAFPSRIALVTSPSGAAVRDMIKILRQRQPGVDIVVVPVLVQGAEAAASIAAGLAMASGLGVDLIIVGRGGGSPEELWPFNEEIVARAIVACRPPVISAVGHEIDVTIADFAADRRAATPSAAAEMAVPDVRQVLANLQALSRRLIALLRRKLTLDRAAVSRLAGSVVLVKPEKLLAAPRQRLDEAWRDMVRAGRQTLARAGQHLAAGAARLESLSPLATLGRGYSVCLSEDGKAVRDAASVNPGDELRVLLQRGRLYCTVRAKEELHD